MVEKDIEVWKGILLLWGLWGKLLEINLMFIISKQVLSRTCSGFFMSGECSRHIMLRNQCRGICAAVFRAAKWGR